MNYESIMSIWIKIFNYFYNYLKFYFYNKNRLKFFIHIFLKYSFKNLIKIYEIKNN